MLSLDLTARRYGVRPSSLLKGASADLAIDLGVALRADGFQREHKLGDWWYLSIFEMFSGGSGKRSRDEVTWV